jgi:type II secretory ATPase GspE/PulE/Tfp pilus assembly ATPase PilB-like protein
MQQTYTRAMRQRCMFLVIQLLMWLGLSQMGSVRLRCQSRLYRLRLADYLPRHHHHRLYLLILKIHPALQQNLHYHLQQLLIQQNL